MSKLRSTSRCKRSLLLAVRHRPSADYAPGIGPLHWPGGENTRAAASRAEEGTFSIVGDSRSFNVGIEQLFEFVVRGHVDDLGVLLDELEPPALSLRKIVVNTQT